MTRKQAAEQCLNSYMNRDKGRMFVRQNQKYCNWRSTWLSTCLDHMAIDWSGDKAKVSWVCDEGDVNEVVISRF